MFKPYDTYIARIPYIESNNSKLRPVLVISKPHGKYGVVAVIPLTSRSDCEVVDFVIEDTAKAGLDVSTVARTHRVTTVLTEYLEVRLGTLAKIDQVAVRESLTSYFEL